MMRNRAKRRRENSSGRTRAHAVGPAPARRVLAAAILLSATAAGAQDDGGDARLQAAQQYAQCMRLAAEDPGKALETARTWRDQGGGDPARHCAATAQFHMGRYAEAARQLTDLGRTLNKESPLALRTRALNQAGRAWLLAGKPARAEAVQAAAIELDPENAELWIARAESRFHMGKYWLAIDDLNRASELTPTDAWIYVFRASAYRHVDALELALEDANRALELAPANAEALLERGIARRLSGDEAGARRDWLKVIEAAPDSPAARDARSNLERMDVDPDTAGTETDPGQPPAE